MTEQQHPITPPPELVREWDYEHGAIVDGSMDVDEYIVIQTSRFRRIADDELEACCEWLREARNHGFGYDMGRILADNLRAAMRPKPPSLAEQALEACERSAFGIPGDRDIIRRALELLQKLEQLND